MPSLYTESAIDGLRCVISDKLSRTVDKTYEVFRPNLNCYKLLILSDLGVKLRWDDKNIPKF